MSVVLPVLADEMATYRGSTSGGRLVSCMDGGYPVERSDKMPRVFRAMRKDADGLPHVEQSASGLGVRSGIDIDVDPHGDVLVNGKGMSVSPNWRDLPLFRIPERLKHLKPGARGSNNTFCFCSGTGPFQRGDFAEGLTLEPDSAIHGAIAPARVMPLEDYRSALEATRSDWQVDET